MRAYYKASSLGEITPFRTQLGLAFLYLATDGKSHEIRRRTISVLEHLVFLLAERAFKFIYEALNEYAMRPRPPVKPSSEDEKPSINKQVRVIGFMLASAAFGDDVHSETREDLLASAIVIAHHSSICTFLASSDFPNAE